MTRLLFTYIPEGPKLPQPLCCPPPPTEEFCPKIQRTPRPPKRYTSPLFLFSLKSLFVVGPSTEQSLKEALTYGDLPSCSSLSFGTTLLSVFWPVSNLCFVSATNINYEFYCCVMYSGVEYVVCCYSECISHTRQASKPKVAGSIPTVVRLIFQLAWCGIYTQSNNTLHKY